MPSFNALCSNESGVSLSLSKLTMNLKATSPVLFLIEAVTVTISPFCAALSVIVGSGTFSDGGVVPDSDVVGVLEPESVLTLEEVLSDEVSSNISSGNSKRELDVVLDVLLVLLLSPVLLVTLALLPMLSVLSALPLSFVQPTSNVRATAKHKIKAKILEKFFILITLSCLIFSSLNLDIVADDVFTLLHLAAAVIFNKRKDKHYK